MKYDLDEIYLNLRIEWNYKKKNSKIQFQLHEELMFHDLILFEKGSQI